MYSARITKHSGPNDTQIQLKSQGTHSRAGEADRVDAEWFGIMACLYDLPSDSKIATFEANLNEFPHQARTKNLFGLHLALQYSLWIIVMTIDYFHWSLLLLARSEPLLPTFGLSTWWYGLKHRSLMEIWACAFCGATISCQIWWKFLFFVQY